MSKINDIKTSINNKECGSCKESYMDGFNFFCDKHLHHKQISAVAKEDCYVLDEELAARLELFEKEELSYDTRVI